MINRLIAWCWAEIDRAIAGLNYKQPFFTGGVWVYGMFTRPVFFTDDMLDDCIVEPRLIDDRND